MKKQICMMMAAMMAAAAPVSYTHLDVYKRQVAYLRGFPDRGHFN